MDKIKELRAKAEEIIARMKALLDKADGEKRDLTAEETVSYAADDKEVEKLKSDIGRREKLLADEQAAVGDPDKPYKVRFNAKPTPKPKEFRNVGEYFYTIRANPYDDRLMALKEVDEERAQSMGTGSQGGFALPDQFRPEIWQVQPQSAIVRPRATVLPAGSPPDAKLTMPALDQTGGSNIYGGVVITHTGEAITMTETSAALREVTLEPKELSAYIIATEKLMNNWDALSSFVNGQLRKAATGAEDYDFMRGDGINKSLGFINSPATITVTRAGAGLIDFADIVAMYARQKMGGNLAWIASQTTLPELITIVDAGNHALWVGGGQAVQSGIVQGIPPTLMGYPVLFAERLPALGTKGDLNLVDLSYYLIKDGSGPYVALSDQLLFLSNRVVFKIRWNVDARPWLNEPIALEGSSTSTVSPFVTLSA